MIDGVLTKPDLSHAQAGLYECNECQQLIEAVNNCGLDCQESLLRNQHLRQFFQGLLDHFQAKGFRPGSA